MADEGGGIINDSSAKNFRAKNSEKYIINRQQWRRESHAAPAGKFPILYSLFSPSLIN